MGDRACGEDQGNSHSGGRLRTLKIPADILRKMHTEPILGRAVVFPVHVDWPELQLTEGQILANAAWLACGGHGDKPFPDPALFSIEIPYIAEMMRGVAGGADEVSSLGI